MKKSFALLLSACLFCLPLLNVRASDTLPSAANEDGLELAENVNAEDNTSLISNARSGILMEPSTGKILFEKNPDEKIAVASMTKMISQILILEAIENESITWDEKLTISSNASGMGGSQIWLETGEVMSIRDLMKGLSMASANDATVALAERIGGTEQGFVDMMNKKAQELGLTSTHFMNSTGLDEQDHYSTARDMSIIVRELLKYDQILEFSSVYEDYLRTDTPNKFWLVNTNKLVRTYPGADGLKTGHTDDALYCMAVTAKKDGLRLVALVFGEESGKVRNKETAELLDYGFNLYKMQKLYTKGDVLGEINIEKGNKDKVEIIANEDIGTITKKTETIDNLTTELKLNEITLPIKPGDVIGKMILKQNGDILGEYDVSVNDEIDKIGFFTLLGRILKGMLT